VFDKIIANFLDPLDIYSNNTSPLVRMFAVEYSREYQMAIKGGLIVNERYVKDFLTRNKV